MLCLKLIATLRSMAFTLAGTSSTSKRKARPAAWDLSAVSATLATYPFSEEAYRVLYHIMLGRLPAYERGEQAPPDAVLVYPGMLVAILKLLLVRAAVLSLSLSLSASLTGMRTGGGHRTAAEGAGRPARTTALGGELLHVPAAALLAE